MIAFFNRQRTGALCLGLAVAFLVIGWWPFSPVPKNRVAWLPDQPGLSFRPPGIVHDERPLPWSPAIGSSGFTIELHLEPGLGPRAITQHILTIHDGELPSALVLCQWKSDLLLRIPDPGNARGFREAGIDGLERKPRVLAVTCSAAGTTFFADGRPLARYPRFVVPAEAVRGRLILGDSASGKQAWTGRIYGVAIHHRALAAREVAGRYRAWTMRDEAALAREPAPVALYLFDERAGDHVSSRVVPPHRLEIPFRYQVVQKTPFVVARDWVALVRTDFRDITVNLLGFVPFGVLAFHYRRLCRPHRMLAAAGFALLAGGGLSLLIEVGQIWLPTRVSSASDLALNTVGTALGVFLAAWTKP